MPSAETSQKSTQIQEIVFGRFKAVVKGSDADKVTVAHNLTLRSLNVII